MGWHLPTLDEATIKPLVNELGVSPLVARLLVLRGYADPAAATRFLSPDAYAPSLPTALPNLRAIADRLQTALDTGQPILIYADYDVDGVVSAALLHDALKKLGGTVDVEIAAAHGIRADMLHRLHLRAEVIICLDLLLQDAAPMPILSLDHHVLKDKVALDNVTLANPIRLPAAHPLRMMSTAGVTWLLAQQLLAGARQTRYLGRLLDLPALGLVGDMADLTADVRHWVIRSLEALRRSERVGLQALATVAQISLGRITADEVAFDLVPRLNAFGRLGNAYDAFRLLTTHDENEAQMLAVQADALNGKRKLTTRQIAEAVYQRIEADPTLLGWNALVLENPHWDGGVLGAVAGQLAHDFGRPVALLTSGHQEVLRGAMRSAGRYDLTLALDEIDDLLLGYGGHASAAGFSLHTDQLPMLRRRLSNALEAQQPNAQADLLQLDAPLDFNELSLDTIRDTERLAPFGNGNPRPTFVARNIQTVRSAKLGREGQHRRLTLRDVNGTEQSVLWWRSSHLPPPQGTFDLAYQAKPIYRDEAHQLQITLVDWQQVAAPDGTEDARPDWVDVRDGLDLAALRADQPDLMVWVEGVAASASPGVPYSTLEAASSLLIYTAPPSQRALEKAIQKVKPQRVYFYADLPNFQTAEDVLTGVYSLLNVVYLQDPPETTLTRLAERLAQPIETIQLALDALAEHLTLDWINQSRFRVLALEQPKGVNSAALARATNETAAYRRYLQRADLEQIIS